MFGDAFRNQTQQPGWNTLMGDGMNGENTYGAGGRNNPFTMQSTMMGQQYAPWGGNPYNVLPMMTQQANQHQNNYQMARLAAMPYNNQAQGIQNQRLNFQDLIAALPQLLGAFGGNILGNDAQGFKTNYGAGASMGGGAALGKTLHSYSG